MGVWDYGPFDNDDAADMIAGLNSSVLKAVKTKDAKAASSHYLEARAAIALSLPGHGTDILGGPSLKDAIAALARMRMDREWLAGFGSPRTIARRIDKELDAVTSRMLRCKGCRKGLGKNEIAALATLAAQAVETPVPKAVRPKSVRRRSR